MCSPTVCLLQQVQVFALLPEFCTHEVGLQHTVSSRRWSWPGEWTTRSGLKSVNRLAGRWFSGSLATVELHSHLSFDGKDFTFLSQGAGMGRQTLLINPCNSLVDVCCQPSTCCTGVLHHSCNHFLCGLELLVCACVYYVVAFCKKTQVESEDVINWL